MLEVDDLTEKKVLDIGSGSGLFSLAARQLGAEVHSFDYDPESVACTKELRSRYLQNDQSWIVEEGDILDDKYLKSLGTFDVVYSWGVLHHTGQIWNAVDKAAALVRENGIFFIALYNDQGYKSIYWRKVKNIYCSGILGRVVVCCIFIPLFFSMTIVKCVIFRKNMFAEYKNKRGMSIKHDWLDWLGGLPFEVAKVEEVFHFRQERGFVLNNIVTTNALGNNQFVFVRKPCVE